MELAKQTVVFITKRSPSEIWVFTPVWLSVCVVNIGSFFIGMVVFSSISFVMTPPVVSDANLSTIDAFHRIPGASHHDLLGVTLAAPVAERK